MAPESGSGPTQPNGPAPFDSRRFVARARTLRGDRTGGHSFHAALERARSDWDAQFPCYAARSSLPPPYEKPPERSEVPFPGKPDTPFPIALAADSAACRHAGLRAPASCGSAHRAVHAWLDLVLGLCAEWWPPAYYPNWAGPWRHPAMCFVAGCLIWGTEAVTEEWVEVLDYAQLVRRLSADPSEYAHSPESAVFWEAAFRGLIDALAEGAGRPDSPPEAADAARAAERVGMSRGAAALRAWQEERGREARPFRFVRLFPGIDSTDWRAMEKTVIGKSDRPGPAEPSLPQHARSLFAERGMSKRAIAALLGVDRRTVIHWLADDQPPPVQS